MFVKKISDGLLGSNTYIVHNKTECIVVDPGTPPKTVMNAVEKEGLKVIAIFITHAHYDHVCHIKGLKEATSAPVYATMEESSALTDKYGNASILFGSGKSYDKADCIVRDGDLFSIGEETLEILHTPGHTDGGICIKGDGFVITGDTLFYMSVGRSDLGRGDHEELFSSIKNKLYTLPEETIVYPGHGSNTTIGFEKANNPYT